MKKLVITALIALAAITSVRAEDGFLKGKVLRIDLKEPIAETGSDGGVFDIDMPSLPIDIGIESAKLGLLKVEMALKKAAEDKNIAMIYLNYDHFSAPMTAMEEIRRYLLDFSRAGKPVVAYGCSLSNGSYYIASAADRIFLNPKGSGSLNGLGSDQYFLKDMLDTLGIKVQLIRHGKFKSAGEMYIRNNMSPENRRQYEELLSPIWNSMVEEMAGSRGVAASELSSWIDNLELGTADTWVEKGLVDGLKYKDEMEQYICHLFGTTDPAAVRRIDIKDYLKEVKMGSGKKIAVLYADGEISRSGNEVAGEKFAARIAKLRRDDDIKAVVFRVNSPGGEVVAADIIRREIELLGKEKPVIASYASYAASGGYLISAGCEQIFTDKYTLTGSIGVFGLIPSIGDAASKVLKVNFEHVGTTPHSGMGNLINGLTPEEEAWYQKEIEQIYDDFVGVVMDGRGKTYEEVDEIAQGRVWSGMNAVELGLCDRTGSLLDAIGYAAEKAGLSKYKLVTYPEQTKGGPLRAAKKKDKDKPLVLARSLAEEPGYRCMAIMDYLKISF